MLLLANEGENVVFQQSFVIRHYPLSLHVTCYIPSLHKSARVLSCGQSCLRLEFCFLPNLLQSRIQINNLLSTDITYCWHQGKILYLHFLFEYSIWIVTISFEVINKGNFFIYQEGLSFARKILGFSFTFHETESLFLH